MTTSLTFAPLLPLWMLAVLISIAALSALGRLLQAPIGALLRLSVVIGIGFFLLNPNLETREGEVIPDILAIAVDESFSISLDDRSTTAAAVASQLSAAASALGLDIVTIPFGSQTETDLEADMAAGLGTIPRQRLSAVVVISDGQIHRLPRAPDAVPVHGIAIGDEERQRDRRIEVIRAPQFGIVGETVQLSLRVIAHGESGTVPVTLYVDGEPFASQPVAVGEEVSLSVPLRQPGETILELEVAPADGELTTLNNRSVTRLTAVRDRLRVLLVSGQPHAGERVWRNTLKSDPSVDLVHFTILKPGNKEAVARPEELNLIEFPHEELFLRKLSSFDVVIFDRYTYRGVLQSFEFEEIARYVERGGAVLISAGPEMAESGSLAARPNLGFILPVFPAGDAREGAFVPVLSSTGQRHPVTRDLPDPAEWGRWARFVPGEVRDGDVILEAENNMPLLVLDRVEKGRIAVLMSDHIWLWAREFDGGGPYRELLRRLVHWLMQEPELEEESLRGYISPTGTLTISRNSLDEAVQPVRIIFPDQRELAVPMTEVGPGQFRATQQVPADALYRLATRTSDGDALYAIATGSAVAAKEAGDVITTTDHLSQLADASGGGVLTIKDAGATGPDLRRVRAGSVAAGPNWLGLPRRDVRDITDVRVRPLAPNWLWALVLGGLAVAAWRVEGGFRAQKSNPTPP